ncbi:sigma factor-like helix-turn-helix DNA-binding protein [Amycolatopsis sp. NPDC004368]
MAYRVLGSHADAEDVVQDAWLRLSRQEQAIDNLGGRLTTVVGRLSLDVLRARQTRPRPDDRLPDGVVLLDGPEDDVALADSVGLALLVVLDALGPGERLAFVLHDLFAVPFEEIGRILGKSTAAAKMLASRAWRKVRETERLARDREREQRDVVRAFLAAARDGDFTRLLQVLDPDVRLTAETPDGVVVVLGATKVASGARLSGGLAATGRDVLVAGRPGVVSLDERGTVVALLAFTIAGGRITELTVVTDPAKLSPRAARPE